MRKQVLACLLLGALGAQAQEKFVVEGQLKNIPDGTVFYLMKQEGNVGSMAATDTLQNGTFRFELTTAGNELESYGLMARDDTKFPPMLLELWVNPGSHLLIQGESSSPLIPHPDSESYQYFSFHTNRLFPEPMKQK